MKSKSKGNPKPISKEKTFTRQEILNFLTHNSPQTFKVKEIARQMGIPQRSYQTFKQNLIELVREGKIIQYQKSQFGLAKMSLELTGELHVKTQGYGYVKRDDGGEEIFISQKNMGFALHQDKVRVKLLAHTTKAETEGVVVEILQHARTQIVGTYRRGRRTGFVVPDNLKIVHDIYVADEDALGAQKGQKVVVEIRHWDHPNSNPEGVITEVLGFPQDHGVAMKAVIRGHELPLHFPAPVEREAAAIPAIISEQEIAHRTDLRSELIFTIDPIDSKDFDDAVSLKQLENGNWLLGVHIADVSHYVIPKSVIDQEALKRGTSVYLVDRVIPMLPEVLSNQICSLQPQTDRLAVSVFMELTPKCQLREYFFRESIIRSQRRFAYEEVQAILDGQVLHDPFESILRQMHQLSQRLTQSRMQHGSLDLDIPEAKVILDDTGRPIDIKPAARLASHRLIEEFMLLANQTVAQHVGLKFKDHATKKLAFVYRIHEKPNPEKIRHFLEFVKALGYELNETQALRPHSLQKFMSDISNEHDRKLIHLVLLRSLMKAKYTTKNVGHFGLGFKHYTHFTSPIRRYPDLMVHRLLKSYTEIEPNSVKGFGLKELEAQCQWNSEREMKAQEAERQSIKLKQVEFMEQFLGAEFDGVISGVVAFGIFVEIPQYLIEGLVHVNDLEPDFYVLNEKRYSLIGQSRGKVYHLGDPVKIRVVRVDRNEKLIDFALVANFRKRRSRK
ncbi:ribonuclease R [candidate division KSB1 bacterium]|nr:ribonuclease R [candidate division KSB1 bacterium]